MSTVKSNGHAGRSKTFRDWNFAELAKVFNLAREDEANDLLQNWMANEQTVSAEEKNLFRAMSKKLARKVQAWNEEELKAKFIFPLVELVDYDSTGFNAFYDRPLDATVENIRLNGIVDMVVASGEYLPAQPYFFLHEYKPEDKSEGNPLGQLLAAMLAANAINEAKIPIYGAYVVGRNWFFVVLQAKEYGVSKQFDGSEPADLEVIFKMLREVKALIEKR